jgi:hypothetical protein
MTADEITPQPDTSSSVIADTPAVVGADVSNEPVLSEDAAMEAAWAKMNPHENVERGEDGKFKAEGTETAELEGAAEGEGDKGNSAVASDIPLPSNLYGLDDVWAGLPPETRQKLAERSNELNARMSDMGRQVSQYKPLAEVADKFSTYFNANLKHPDGSAVTPASAVEYLFGIQAAMDKDAPSTLMNIIDTYGAREKIAAMLGVQAAPQQQNDNRQLLAKIDRLEAIISQANDPSRLEEVITTRELRSEGQRLKDSEPLVKEIPEKRWDFFVNEGVEALGDKATVKAVFEYAVKAAIEADPALRAKTDAARKAAEDQRQKAEAAKRANGVNVTSTSTGKARPVSDDQAMEAVWAKYN